MATPVPNNNSHKFGVRRPFALQNWREDFCKHDGGVLVSCSKIRKINFVAKKKMPSDLLALLCKSLTINGAGEGNRTLATGYATGFRRGTVSGRRMVCVNASCAATYWRRGSESNGVFTDYQPQYPDLQGHSSIDSKGLQAVFGITRHLPDLTRHIPVAHSVIEEIVEGFVEGFFNGLEPFPATAQLVEITTTARLSCPSFREDVSKWNS